MNPRRRIRVLAVDDSALFRKVLTDILSQDEDIEFVGCATDAYDARDRLAHFQVDVMTLDLDMPRMPGLTFLKLIMERKPMPVIVVSAHTPTGSQKAVDALFSGAFAVLGKPDNMDFKGPFGERLIADIKRAAAAPRCSIPASRPQANFRTTTRAKSSRSAPRPAARRRWPTCSPCCPRKCPES